MIYMKIWKRGDSREKGGGGNEIHAPSACEFKVKITKHDKKKNDKDVIGNINKYKTIFFYRHTYFRFS
jgi:hypothetical protein